MKNLLFFACFVSLNVYSQKETIKLEINSVNCVEQFNEKICCDNKKVISIPVITNKIQYEQYDSCKNERTAIREVLGEIDFNKHNLVVVTPGDLSITFEMTGTPTSMGVEWQMYKQISAICLNDTNRISLDCSPTPGYAGAFYYKVVPKTINGIVKCMCDY